MEDKEIKDKEIKDKEIKEEKNPDLDIDMQAEDKLSDETKAEIEEAKEETKEEVKEENKEDPKDIQIKELNDKILRSLAEFDNYRKRTEKEKSNMFEMGESSIIEKMLPVIDNFERGLKEEPSSESDRKFYDGMMMIYKQLMKILEDTGVIPIECVGKEFDTNYHNAVMHIEDDTVGENIVTEELQKGYMYKDNVLRHAMVKVAN